jgi:ABC-type transport system involved in cytochrome c biogenesis permease subunit
MKKRLPIYGVVIAALCVVLAPLNHPQGEGSVVRDFARLPVLAEGRLKPFDSVARSTLLQIQARQTVYLDDMKELSPDTWLLDTLFNPEKADTYRTFVIDNPDLLSLIGKTEETLAIHYQEGWKQAMAVVGFLPSRYRRFSFNEIKPYFPQVEAQMKLAEPVAPVSRTRFQAAVVQLYGNLVQYIRLRRTLTPEGAQDFLGELLHFQETLPDGVEALRAKQAGKTYDEAKANAMIDEGQRFIAMSETTGIYAIPPEGESTDPNDWRSAGHALLESFSQGYVSPSVLAYAGMGYAWRRQETASFAHIVSVYGSEVEKRFPKAVRKTWVESIFNAAEPFYSGLLIYVAAFLFVLFSWLWAGWNFRGTARGLVVLAWVVTTAGIAARMWLEGRPPVTNLYSSALFIGWGAVGLCLILEALYRNGIGTAAGCVVGFATLLIAQQLSLAGDTLEMMRAVLDSNFWLGTHVVVVTTGYAATFLAGLLAVFYVVRGVFTSSLDKATADSLGRMVYGIVCFATLFSFVGTTLGGIWADQSWGRFWGWDPKENGALIIVVWNALILHARWGGLVRQRGLMCLAIFGNVVTSWSWFGTNMLGIGLHSYGFTAAAFWWLSAFIASQLALIAIGNIPLEKWRSFRSGTAPRPADAGLRPVSSGRGGA